MNPLDKCCETTPSGCVAFTGSLGSDTRTVYECQTSINEIIEQMDSNLTLVLNHIEIKVSDLVSADTCKLIYDNIANLKVKSTDDFIYADKLILQLVSLICNLQAQIQEIYISDTIQQSFFDKKLPPEFKDLVDCLVCDDGCDAVLPDTLGNFLKIIAGKIKRYETLNSALSCEFCN